MYEGQHAPGRVLAMFSPMLGGPQPDWPPSVMQTGTAQLPDRTAPLPDALAQFLERDDRPLAIFTLSSAASNDAGDFYRNGLEAAGALGLRALLITSGLAASSRLPEPLAGMGLPRRLCRLRAGLPVCGGSGACGRHRHRVQGHAGRRAADRPAARA